MQQKGLCHKTLGLSPQGLPLLYTPVLEFHLEEAKESGNRRALFLFGSATVAHVSLVDDSLFPLR